jgi:hypothetical protein
MMLVSVLLSRLRFLERLLQQMQFLEREENADALVNTDVDIRAF